MRFATKQIKMKGFVVKHCDYRTHDGELWTYIKKVRDTHKSCISLKSKTKKQVTITMLTLD